MKKILFGLAVVLMSLISFEAGAQKFGVMAGYTSSSSGANDSRAESVSKYHVGVALRLPSILGFSVQPAVLYHVKATSLKDNKNAAPGFENLNTRVGYLEIPVQLQWGINLLVARPYLLAEPFIGVGINTRSSAKDPITGKKITLKNAWDDSNIKRWEYGLGLGGGVEVWKLQISAKYFWNFGSLCKDGKKEIPDNIKDAVGGAFRKGKNFNGVSLSVMYMF